MKNNLLIIILVASLAFNIAFIAIFAYFRINPPHPPLPPKLDVSQTEKKTEWFSYLKRTRYEQMKINHQIEQAKVDFFNELEKKNPQNDSLRLILKQIIRYHTKREMFLGKRLIKARMKMSPQEAKNFFSKDIFPHRCRNNPPRLRRNSFK